MERKKTTKALILIGKKRLFFLNVFFTIAFCEQPWNHIIWTKEICYYCIKSIPIFQAQWAKEIITSILKYIFQNILYVLVLCASSLPFKNLTVTAKILHTSFIWVTMYILEQNKNKISAISKNMWDITTFYESALVIHCIWMLSAKVWKILWFHK